MLKRLTFTALLAAMLPTLVDASSATSEALTDEAPAPQTITEVTPVDMQAPYQDCFYGTGPGASCIQCICVDAETRAFEYYCSGCLN